MNSTKNETINCLVSDIFDKYCSSNANSQIYFDIDTSLEIIKKVSKIFRKEKTVLQISKKSKDSNIVIVGDIHGSLGSLIHIFNKNGSPQKTQYLFLGDYVDRGENSCEVLILLYAYKCLYPHNIYLLRGNHEFRRLNDKFGFKEECTNRVKQIINGKVISRSNEFYTKITRSYKYLPLCAILNNKIFCVHGGITRLLKNRKQLFNMKKVTYNFMINGTPQTEFLWSDPDQSISNYDKSPREIGSIFGENALDDFLTKMKFDLVIRGHEYETNGYNWPFGINNRILTVFSSSHYCGDFNNAAVALVNSNCDVDLCVFEVNN